MAGRQLNTSQAPLTKADLKDDLNYFAIPEDTLQLQVDTLNVYQNLVALDSFPIEYQRKIENYYRFSATRMNTDTSKPAPMTITTMDLI